MTFRQQNGPMNKTMTEKNTMTDKEGNNKTIIEERKGRQWKTMIDRRQRPRLNRESNDSQQHDTPMKKTMIDKGDNDCLKQGRPQPKHRGKPKTTQTRLHQPDRNRGGPPRQPQKEGKTTRKKEQPKGADRDRGGPSGWPKNKRKRGRHPGRSQDGQDGPDRAQERRRRKTSGTAVASCLRRPEMAERKKEERREDGRSRLPKGEKEEKRWP